MKNDNNTKLQKEINDLFKKLNIDISHKSDTKKNINDYKLHTKFPTKFSQGKLTITNSTK